tara:strand:+ start:38084 stop:39016 length:933 start_codon:yes stop_codon:yes gene_type:complete
MEIDLSPYIQRIKNGDVVAFPTETVYGLGANAWNPSAIKKVFETKGRPPDNPLIVHLANKDRVLDFADHIPEKAQKLMNAFWPGPLTIVLKKKPEVLDLITAGLDTVALRIPDHDLARSFITKTGPLVAPSANRSGRPSPTKAEHVKTDFGIDFPVIDGGATQVGLESTVVDLSEGQVVILRPGKIGVAELESVIGKGVLISDSGASTPKSPGQKYSHYKPKANVFYGEIESIDPNNLYLLQSNAYPDQKNIINYNGDLGKLSRELYDRFRQADLHGFESVCIEELEEFKAEQPSYFAALMNRIEKARSA